MNCKPGDLAIIVKKSMEISVNGLKFKFAFEVGTIVKTIKCTTDKNRTLKDGWDIEQKIRIKISAYGILIYDEYKDWCPDEILKPLHGLEDDDSVSDIKEDELIAA